MGQTHPKTDGSISSLQTAFSNYFSSINKKIDRYVHRLSFKTNKTLTKLVSWEKQYNGKSKYPFKMNKVSYSHGEAALKDMEGWQQSGLIGVMKKLPFKTKLVKNTQIKLLYDFLYHTHLPVSQPWVFRVGYGL